eukprot:scaffold18907_cov33-Tisochrysis_lutea.AAC.4
MEEVASNVAELLRTTAMRATARQRGFRRQARHHETHRKTMSSTLPVGCEAEEQYGLLET